MVHTSVVILAAIALNIVPIMAAPIVRDSNQLKTQEDIEQNHPKPPGATTPTPSRRDVQDNLQMFSRDIGKGVNLFARDKHYLFRHKLSDDDGGSMHRLHKSDLTDRGQISPIDLQKRDHLSLRNAEEKPLGRRDVQDESQIFARGLGSSKPDLDVRSNDHLRRDLLPNGIPAPGGPPGRTFLKRDIGELD